MVLDGSLLGLEKSYKDKSVTIGKIDYVFQQGYLNDDGQIQMRCNSTTKVQSMLYNITGYDSYIKKITVNLAKTLTANRLGLYISNSVLDTSITPQGAPIKNTDKLTVEYENTANDETIKYFRLEHLTASNTAYIDSIIIELA